MRFPRRAERGAALVEGAFAIPIFFVMVLGLIDFGMLAFESNKASNAARDGARVGIIDYLEADDVGSAHFNAIKSEIESKLQGQTIDLEVNCLTPGGADIDCTNAVVDQDRISVKVTWDRKAISPLGNALGIGSVEVDGESRMTIIGRPTGGPASPPPTCVPTGITVTPNPVTRSLTNELANDLTVSVAGSGTCSSQTLWLVSSDGTSETEICSSGCLGDTVYAKDDDSFWTQAGPALAVLRDSAGNAMANGTFDVQDPGPAGPGPCVVTGVSVSPSSVDRFASGVHAGGLQDNLSVVIDGSGGCTSLELTLTDIDGSIALLCDGSCLGPHIYTGTSDLFWNAGQAVAEVRDGGSLVATSTFEVTEPPPCVIESLVFDPSSVPSGAGEKVLSASVTATLTTSGSCSDLTVTLTASDGVSSVELCSGGLCGNGAQFTFSDTDAHSNTKDWPADKTGKVEVTGDAATLETFSVT